MGQIQRILPRGGVKRPDKGQLRKTPGVASIVHNEESGTSTEN